jgi:hypothetical protein
MQQHQQHFKQLQLQENSLQLPAQHHLVMGTDPFRHPQAAVQYAVS